jgi:hypothetical protein
LREEETFIEVWTYRRTPRVLILKEEAMERETAKKREGGSDGKRDRVGERRKEGERIE